MRPVKAGEAIKAADFNAIIRAVDPSGRMTPGNRLLPVWGVLVGAKNVSEIDMLDGHAAHISGVAWPSGALPHTERTITLQVGGNTTGALCIAVEPIKSGKFGRVLVQGLAWVKTTGTGAAASLSGAVGMLSIGSTGAASVLYTEPSGSVSLILLGGGGGTGTSGASWAYFLQGSAGSQ